MILSFLCWIIANLLNTFFIGVDKDDFMLFSAIIFVTTGFMEWTMYLDYLGIGQFGK